MPEAFPHLHVQLDFLHAAQLTETAFYSDLVLRIELFSADPDGYAPTSRVSIAACGTAEMLIDLAQQTA